MIVLCLLVHLGGNTCPSQAHSFAVIASGMCVRPAPPRSERWEREREGGRDDDVPQKRSLVSPSHHESTQPVCAFNDGRANLTINLEICKENHASLLFLYIKLLYVIVLQESQFYRLLVDNDLVNLYVCFSSCVDSQDMHKFVLCIFMNDVDNFILEYWCFHRMASFRPHTSLGRCSVKAIFAQLYTAVPGRHLTTLA